MVVFGLSFDNSTEGQILWWHIDSVMKGAEGVIRGGRSGAAQSKERQNGHKNAHFELKSILCAQQILYY